MPDVRVLFVIGLSAAVITGFMHPARKRAAPLGWRKLERVGVLAAICLCGLILVLGPFDHAYQGEIGTTDSSGGW